MASLSDSNNDNVDNETSQKEKKEEIAEKQESVIAPTPENTSSVDLFGTNRPVNICSPFNLQNTYKPVFGSSRSILKPSALFSDANSSTSIVTFGSNYSKGVKLKPSVLANPFVISETSDNTFKSDCDEKPETLPSCGENEKSKEESGNSTSGPLKFVPLNASSSTSTSISSTVNIASTVVSNSESNSSNSSSSTIVKEFVFGQNLHERVTIENENAQEHQKPIAQNGITFSEMLFSSAIKQESANAKQKDSGSSHEFSNGNSKTLSISAKEYEEARSVKRKYEEVTVVTGEEDEQNVLQINCKLFAFDNASSTWAERGRGNLRVNDKETSEGRTSRLVMRLLGNWRVVLNTKIWSDMSVEHVSKKSVRLTAIDNDGQVRIYLVMASPKDSDQLYNVLSNRIQKKKLKTSGESTSTYTSKLA